MKHEGSVVAPELPGVKGEATQTTLTGVVTAGLFKGRHENYERPVHTPEERMYRDRSVDRDVKSLTPSVLE